MIDDQSSYSLSKPNNNKQLDPEIQHLTDLIVLFEQSKKIDILEECHEYLIKISGMINQNTMQSRRRKFQELKVRVDKCSEQYAIDSEMDTLLKLAGELQTIVYQLKQGETTELILLNGLECKIRVETILARYTNSITQNNKYKKILMDSTKILEEFQNIPVVQANPIRSPVKSKTVIETKNVKVEADYQIQPQIKRQIIQLEQDQNQQAQSETIEEDKSIENVVVNAVQTQLTTTTSTTPVKQEEEQCIESGNSIRVELSTDSEVIHKSAINESDAQQLRYTFTQTMDIDQSQMIKKKCSYDNTPLLGRNSLVRKNTNQRKEIQVIVEQPRNKPQFRDYFRQMMRSLLNPCTSEEVDRSEFNQQL